MSKIHFVVSDCMSVQVDVMLDESIEIIGAGGGVGIRKGWGYVGFASRYGCCPGKNQSHRTHNLLLLSNQLMSVMCARGSTQGTHVSQCCSFAACHFRIMCAREHVSKKVYSVCGQSDAKVHGFNG